MMNMPDYFNPEESSQIIEMYKNKFREDIRDLFPDKYPSFNLDELSPQKIFWLNHLSQFTWLEQEITEMEEDLDFDNDIFEILTDSEYSKDFLEALDGDQSFKKICKQVLAIYKQQLDFIKMYHVDQDIKDVSNEYRPNLDLGDIDQKIGGNRIEIPNSQLSYLAGEDQHYSRIEKAVNILNQLAPESFKRLNTFTKYLVPLNDKGMVSFSSEALPFYSCINFRERDNVDLLDDLLHENGHHQLNFYLYNYELIDEEDPNLYFSPWRECLRPLRGIYHGYCTFYWAYDLFKNLLKFENLSDHFNQDEIDKISRRFLEEREMLLASYQELIIAQKNGYISKEGMQVVINLQRHINDDQSFVSGIISRFNHSQQLEEFRQQLATQRQEAYSQL